MRSSSSTSSSCACSPSSAETTNTLWATMIGGCDLVMHAAGWLEGGLTASYEKFVLDLELLRVFAELGRDDQHALGDDDRRLRPRHARRGVAGGRPHRLV